MTDKIDEEISSAFSNEIKALNLKTNRKTDEIWLKNENPLPRSPNSAKKLIAYDPKSPKWIRISSSSEEEHSLSAKESGTDSEENKSEPLEDKVDSCTEFSDPEQDDEGSTTEDDVELIGCTPGRSAKCQKNPRDPRQYGGAQVCHMMQQRNPDSAAATESPLSLKGTIVYYEIMLCGADLRPVSGMLRTVQMRHEQRLGVLMEVIPKLFPIKKGQVRLLWGKDFYEVKPEDTSSKLGGDEDDFITLRLIAPYMSKHMMDLTSVSEIAAEAEKPKEKEPTASAAAAEKVVVPIEIWGKHSKWLTVWWPRDR